MVVAVVVAVVLAIWLLLLLLLVLLLQFVAIWATKAIVITQNVLDHVADVGMDVMMAENPLVMQYWGDLASSMFTLLQTICGGISWNDCTLPLRQIQDWLCIPLVLYIVFVYFCVLNSVTGVFCSTAIEAAERDTDMKARQILETNMHYDEKLRKIFDMMDVDGSLAAVSIF